MSHFASGRWVLGLADEAGPLARFETLTHTAAISQTTLFTAPRAGFYRIEAAAAVLAVGTGAGQTWDIDIEVLSVAGNADTLANFVAAVDALTAGDGKTGDALVYLPTGGTVKYTTNSNGTVTTPATLAVGIVVSAV